MRWCLTFAPRATPDAASAILFFCWHNAHKLYSETHRGASAGGSPRAAQRHGSACECKSHTGGASHSLLRWQELHADANYLLSVRIAPRLAEVCDQMQLTRAHEHPASARPPCRQTGGSSQMRRRPSVLAVSHRGTECAACTKLWSMADGPHAGHQGRGVAARGGAAPRTYPPG